MKARLKVKQLTDADTIGIALVERGANSAPIKIMMSDGGKTGMLDFTKAIFKSAAPDPGVLAVIVKKGADTDSLKELIKKSGFSVDRAEKAKGATVFLQKEDVELDGEGIGLVKLDEKVAVVCAFRPSDNSTSFDENLNQDGFIPGFEMSLSSLRKTIANALLSDDASKGDSAKNMKAALEQFAAHVGDLIDTLPDNAFAFDQAVAASDTAVSKTDSKEPEEETEEEDEEEKIVKKAEETEEEDEDSEDESGNLLKTISAQLSDLTSRFSAVEKTAEKAAKNSQDAVKIAKSVDDTLGTRILASANDDKNLDTDGGADVIELMDTAMGRGMELK